MPVYKINCSVCKYDKPQYYATDFGSRVVKCPNCGHGCTATKIKTKGVVEAEADGVIGYLRYDNKRHADGSNR